MNLVMTPEDAAYAVVHDYPGGAFSLGPRLNIKPQVLINKVNPNAETNRLSLAESVRLQQVTGDHRIFEACATTLGYAVLPLPQLDDGLGNDELLAVQSQLIGELSTLSADLMRALSDGKVTETEERLLAEQAKHLYERAMQLIQIAAKVYRPESRVE